MEPLTMAGGEGWLVNGQQQLVVQFKPDASMSHGSGWKSAPKAGSAPIRRYLSQGERCRSTSPLRPGNTWSGSDGEDAVHRFAEATPQAQDPL